MGWQKSLPKESEKKGSTTCKQRDTYFLIFRHADFSNGDMSVAQHCVDRVSDSEALISVMLDGIPIGSIGAVEQQGEGVNNQATDTGASRGADVNFTVKTLLCFDAGEQALAI